jgi:hypothetical protein
MKRIFSALVIALALATLPVQAQLKLGITAGLNIPRMHLTDHGYKSDLKPYVEKARPGFLLGPTAIFTLPGFGLGFDVSALYDFRGVKPSETSLDARVAHRSLQIPVNVRYGVNLGDMVDLFVYAGPQFGICLNKDSQSIDTGHNSAGDDMELLWQPFSSAMSMNVGIGGVVMEKVQVKVGYNFALQNTGEFVRVNNVTGKTGVVESGKIHSCQVSISYLF